jgi:hypothetical protein
MVYWVGITLTLSLLLRLPVHDWYYVEITAWASLPYFQYYSVYWFMTGTTWSLLHELTLILPVLLRLLFHDWYYVEFTV